MERIRALIKQCSYYATDKFRFLKLFKRLQKASNYYFFLIFREKRCFLVMVIACFTFRAFSSYAPKHVHWKRRFRNFIVMTSKNRKQSLFWLIKRSCIVLGPLLICYVHCFESIANYTMSPTMHQQQLFIIVLLFTS